MKLRRIILHLTLAVLVVAGFAAASVSAAGNTTKSTGAGATAGNVQGYASAKPVHIGAIVQLTGTDASMVAPATAKNPAQMYGVAVDPHLLSITITDSSLANETYVASSGTYAVLVDTQGGAIKSGDYVTISALDGVAMKAGTSDKTVFGRAVAAFDGKSNVLGSTTLKDASGGTKTVQLGIVPVAINIQRNPNQKSTKANLPNALQKAGEALAQKTISPLRVYLGAVVAVMTLVVTVSILYSGIRSSITAIGRNPLSKRAVFRGMLEVVLTGLLILIIGLFGVYLLLKL